MKRLLLILLIPLILGSPVMAQPWSGDWLPMDIPVEEEVEYVYISGVPYLPFKSVSEAYEYMKQTDVVFREYIFGEYDCVNYQYPDYFGFTLDFIEEARQDKRWFGTDYVYTGGSTWTLRVVFFVRNDLYAAHPYDLNIYPIYLGKVD